MDSLVTATVDDKDFAPPGRYDAYPGWLLGPSLLLQVGEFADMMDVAVLH